MVSVVPVIEEVQPPAPPKLERQPSLKAKANNKYSRGEALDEVAEGDEDEYEKAVTTPVAPTTPAFMKPMTRVDKMRMLARSGLPKN